MDTLWCFAYCRLYFTHWEIKVINESMTVENRTSSSVGTNNEHMMQLVLSSSVGLFRYISNMQWKLSTFTALQSNSEVIVLYVSDPIFMLL